MARKKFGGNIDSNAPEIFQSSKKLSRAGEAQHAASERKRSRQAGTDRAKGFNTTEKTRESVVSRNMGAAKKSMELELASAQADVQGFKKPGNGRRSIEMAEMQENKE